MSEPATPYPRSPWMSVPSVADYTGHHRSTVRVALESGELHGHQRRYRGRWNLHIDAVDAWMRGEDGTAACGCSQLGARRHAG